jgi:hypothetical protein
MYYNLNSQTIPHAAWTKVAIGTRAYSGSYNTSSITDNSVVFGRTGWWFYALASQPSGYSGGTTRRLNVDMSGSIWEPYTEYLNMHQNKDSAHRWRPQSFGIVKVTGTGAMIWGQIYHNIGSNMTIAAKMNLCFVQWLAPT